jgi:hypothetical protein
MVMVEILAPDGGNITNSMSFAHHPIPPSLKVSEDGFVAFFRQQDEGIRTLAR